MIGSTGLVDTFTAIKEQSKGAGDAADELADKQHNVGKAAKDVADAQQDLADAQRDARKARYQPWCQDAIFGARPASPRHLLATRDLKRLAAHDLDD